jgi:hypothetical protein
MLNNKRFCFSRELLELVKHNAISYVEAVIKHGRISTGTDGNIWSGIPELFLEPGISYRLICGFEIKARKVVHFYIFLTKSYVNESSEEN